MIMTSVDDFQDISIESELKRAYLDYAMSVIVGRALPDARDGLKPVQRRILFAMNNMGNDFNKKHIKSAKIIGEVIGKYHPHGDSSVYDAIVRLAQDFSLRYPLIDGQGNFGSVDGDSAAAFRYTEIRMSKITHQILSDLEKETVSLADNYDNTEKEPTVMPTRIPNLLVNGVSGIAVGMATNIPPHNIAEIMNACIAMIDDPEIDLSTLMTHILGPDFPTSGIINGKSGILQAYKTGRGKVLIRARATIETDKSGRQSIVATELPYQVNKARLLEKIGYLVKEKKIEGISAIRDESDREGIRVVIEIKRADNPEVVLNQLYHLTQFQVTFGINMVALDGKQPRCMNLRELISLFVQHRRDVVRKRTLYELKKAHQRAHVLEGLALSIVNLDEIIALIKAAPTPNDAKNSLMSKQWALKDLELPEGIDSSEFLDIDEAFGVMTPGLYQLSERQSQAILELRLQKLTGLEREKIMEEFSVIIQHINELNVILNSYTRLMEVIREECVTILDDYQDERKTEIIDSIEHIEDIDLIPNEPVIISLSQGGYLKSQSTEEYQAQKRGGKGKGTGQLKVDDYVKLIRPAMSHNTLLCLTNKGRLYWLPAYHIPISSRASKGRPVNNYIRLEENEIIQSIVALDPNEMDGQYLVMVTKNATIKKVSLSHFSRPRANGIIAIDLVENDELVSVQVAEDNDEIMLFASNGKSCRFTLEQCRALGRTARGVRGMSLGHLDHLISALILKSEDDVILTVSENGYGKRSSAADYRQTNRGAKGVTAMKVTEKTGPLAKAISITQNSDLLIITSSGVMIRTPASDISIQSRSTQGVRLIRTGDQEYVQAVQSLDDDENTENEGDDVGAQ